MKLTVNVAEDAELRAFVKDLIRGQVTKILREELQSIVSEQLEARMKNVSEMQFDYKLREALKDAVHKILTQKFEVSAWRNDFIKPYIEQRLNDVLANTNWKQQVETLAMEKIKSLLK